MGRAVLRPGHGGVSPASGRLTSQRPLRRVSSDRWPAFPAPRPPPGRSTRTASRRSTGSLSGKNRHGFRAGSNVVSLPLPACLPGSKAASSRGKAPALHSPLSGSLCGVLPFYPTEAPQLLPDSGRGAPFWKGRHRGDGTLCSCLPFCRTAARRETAPDRKSTRARRLFFLSRCAQPVCPGVPQNDSVHPGGRALPAPARAPRFRAAGRSSRGRHCGSRCSWKNRVGAFAKKRKVCNRPHGN